MKKINHPLKRKAVMASLVILGLITAFVGTYVVFLRPKPQVNLQKNGELIQMSISQLKEYDGTDSSKSIYLAYEGKIYDVSAGRTYYEPGGTYHWLTGQDATNDLNMVGGDIIKRKYPVVGTIVN